jgi:mRNA deadenylase 3'-5' endonuclease subunit Ccr4
MGEESLSLQVVDLLRGEELANEVKSVITSPVRRVAEPVPRRLVPLGPPVPPFVQKSRFTVLTYNILADLYTTTQQFPTSEAFALQWQYRRQLILKELAMYNADIVCLQEVQSTSFHEDLKPEMDRRGFDAVFKKKTQVTSLVASTARLAIFGAASLLASLLSQIQHQHALCAMACGVELNSNSNGSDVSKQREWGQLLLIVSECDKVRSVQALTQDHPCKSRDLFALVVTAAWLPSDRDQASTGSLIQCRSAMSCSTFKR